MSNTKDLMEGNDKKVLVVGDGMHAYNPIQEEIKKSGVVMPDMVATGTLSVENSNEKEEKFNKKNIPLPKLGDKFMLGGNEFKVIYINPGFHRFTCEPCKSVY
jgi:hypothetical protein